MRRATYFTIILFVALLLGFLSGRGLIAASNCYTRATASWSSAAICLTGMQSGSVLIANSGDTADWKYATKTVAANMTGASVDGTECTKAEAQINGGRKRWSLTCTDNNAATWWNGLEMPAGWGGGTIRFVITALSVNATPSGDLQVDCKCQCRGAGTPVDNTWGTVQSVVLTFATQYNRQRGISPATTCNGTCAVANSTVELNWQCNVNAAGTTATMADVRVLDGGVQYATGGSDA